MRVALLTREYPPEVYGGAGVHVANLARSLAPLAEVGVHCFGQPRPDPLVASTHLPWDALAGDAPHLAALRAVSVDLAMAAAVGGAEIVHSHTWYANLAGHLVRLLYGVPHVVTTHSLEPLRPWKVEQLGGGYALSCFCERTAVEAADAVVAVSSAMRDDVLATYPAVDGARVHVIHNGVDTDLFRPVTDGGRLASLGIDADRPAVVFVGRITRQKGLVHLLHAAPHLPAGVQLVLCAGEPDTQELAAEVRRLVAALRERRGGVVWVDRLLESRELAAVLTHASVFVCPSVYEPFGIVNLEAMACGTAVVASAVGGIPEVVLDGETGTLVAFEPGPDGGPADPDRFARDLAAAITPLAEDAELAARMGRAGRQRVLEHFGWEAVARRTVELYAALLGR